MVGAQSQATARILPQLMPEQWLPTKAKGTLMDHHMTGVDAGGGRRAVSSIPRSGGGIH